MSDTPDVTHIDVTTSDGKSIVAAVRTSPETVIEDYARLLDIARVSEALRPDTTTILKNNISWHMLYPSANTTPWQIEGVTRKLRDEGFDDLVVVENRTVVTQARKGERLNNFTPVHEKYRLPVRYNFNPADMRWVTYEPKSGPFLVLDKVFPKGVRIPDYFFGKNVVHLPTVKTHIYTDYTCALKNAFGGLLDKTRHYTHSVIHETLVDLLRVQKEIQAGTFAVADATTAGSGPGPRTMTPVVKNLLLASNDQVAIDAVAAKLIGFDPMDVKCIRLAHEAGLGKGRLDEIEVLGDLDTAEVKNTNWDFVVGDNAASKVGDFFWFGPMKPLAKLMFQTPMVNAFIMGSFVYHDYIWYPLQGRKVVDRWLHDTEWGKLFLRYGDPFEKKARGLARLRPRRA
ncbi:MAG: DUF362 domain-containing protein [Deltaproteobacteria bacterium]|nr:MAG: DUF362 domain-containing protein [Deltaproteobacteria bacterium]